MSGSILSVVSNQNVESKTEKNVESNIAFGQLSLRKIIKTVATRCQILWLKCTKIQNSAGAQPQTPLGELTALPRPLAGCKGYTSEWMVVEGMGLAREGRGGECCGV